MLTCGCAALLGPAAMARPVKVALTFDDLPGLTLSTDQAYVDGINRDLVAGLRRHHFPATGFVNEGKVDALQRERQLANLRTWLAAGMDLGNHTYSHASPNALGAQAYIADIVRGEPALRALLRSRGKRLEWFRHPYLETGSPEAVKDAIDEWLHLHKYRIAPVTLEADDWEFALPYDAARARGDMAAAARIRSEYVLHTSHRIDWYRSAARALFGHDIAYVMLLHATRLNADCIDELAALLSARDMRPVRLAKALRDPAYRTPDRYAGRDGIEWLQRWSATLGRPLPWASFEDPPKDVEEGYDKLDVDRH